MNSNITVEDCLCLTNPWREFAVFAVNAQTLFTEEFEPAQEYLSQLPSPGNNNH